MVQIGIQIVTTSPRLWKNGTQVPSTIVKIVACLTLFQIFSQLPCDADASWCAGGTGSVLQVNQTVFRCFHDHVFSFVWSQTIRVDSF